MTKWILKGLATGIKTTAYPSVPETAPGVSPGRPGTTYFADKDMELIKHCPAKALFGKAGSVRVDYRRCIHCFQCTRTEGYPSIDWEDGFEWASLAGYPERDQVSITPLGRPFSRSVHIRIVDAGACGACMSEIAQLGKPYYNFHRLGLFVTPTPRKADILLAVGPLTDHMRLALQKTYEAMPSPRRVVAVGTCAISGGPFGPSFISGAGIHETIPVDFSVPGCPPPPLAVLHGLLLAAGRAEPVPLKSRDSARDNPGKEVR